MLTCTRCSARGDERASRVAEVAVLPAHAQAYPSSPRSLASDSVDDDRPRASGSLARGTREKGNQVSIILELDDDRELLLPEMSDEAARRFKRALLAAEKKKGTSPAVRDLIAAAVGAFKEARDLEHERTGTDGDRIVAELRRVRDAVLADREMYPDELGEFTKSRAVKPDEGESK